MAERVAQVAHSDHPYGRPAIAGSRRATCSPARSGRRRRMSAFSARAPACTSTGGYWVFGARLADPIPNTQYLQSELRARLHPAAGAAAGPAAAEAARQCGGEDEAVA